MLRPVFLLEMALVLYESAVLALYGNFTKSCSNVALHNGATNNLDILTATCLENDDDHSPHNSTLDLNLCLGVDQHTGTLDWSI